MKKAHHFLPGLPAFAIGILILASCNRQEETAAPPPPNVLVTAAATRDVDVYKEWVGTLDGSENADVRARVTGNLLKRDYQEGSFVKKGDLLFEIDPRPFEAALAQAVSELDQGVAAQVASQAEAQRSTDLFNKKVISEQEYTNKTQLNQASEAKVAALKANVDQAQLNLDFCKVTSPIDGISGVAQAQVGDLVGTGVNTTLTQVSTLDPAKILFPVSESDYLDAQQRVEVSLGKPFDQRPDAIEVVLANGSIFPHKARLLSVDRQVNASTGTILVTALLPNPGNVLRPGFFARARIVAQVLKDAVVVPQRAVYEVQGSYQLGVVNTDGTAEIRPVTVGARVGMDWVISSGLKPGEKVIVEGLQKVKAGMPVTAQPWVPPAETPPASEDGTGGATDSEAR